MTDPQTEIQGDRLQFLGHLAGALAHEIKNPLSTININLQLLREDWADGAAPKEVRAVRKIDLLLGEVKRLETILNGFLNYTRGHKQNPEVVKIQPVLQRVADLMLPELQRTGCTLRVLTSDTLPTVEIDVASIQQALINLITNARDAMPKGGEILITTTTSDDTLRIQVTDSGAGIRPDQLEKIFKPYFSTKKTGTGLGLPTSRRIVEEHGGTLTVASEPGKGSSFLLTLPAHVKS